MRPSLELQLVSPSERWRETFLRGLRELREEGLPWYFGGDIESAPRDFASFVESKLREPARTHLWAISEDEFVGRISVRHELTAALRREGGHIGYDTVPSFRRRGVATEMLRQALPFARAASLTSLLLTCNATNQASIRVIEKNGGVLCESKILDSNKPPKRYYWIHLSSP